MSWVEQGDQVFNYIGMLHRFDLHLVDALAELEAVGAWHSSGTARQSGFDQTLRVIFQIIGAMAEFEPAPKSASGRVWLLLAANARLGGGQRPTGNGT
jgi:hypothetical protein